MRHGGQKGESSARSFRRYLGNNYLKVILKDYYPRCGLPTFKGNTNF